MSEGFPNQDNLPASRLVSWVSVAIVDIPSSLIPQQRLMSSPCKCVMIACRIDRPGQYWALSMRSSLLKIGHTSASHFSSGCTRMQWQSTARVRM